MHIRKLFAGSNSALGFYSLFDHILGPQARKVYLLKGGPGTGKSRFMEEIAAELGEAGAWQEQFYCSSDSHSLDAVSFPELGVAVIDATFPHALDAKWPGVRDELICLGQYWKGAELEGRRDEIMAAGEEKSGHFAAAFRFFAAALSVEENLAARGSKVRRDCSRELGKILDKVRGAAKNPAEPTQARRLFASALTPEGYVSQIKALVSGFEFVYVLTGSPGTGKAEYLELVLKNAELAGLRVEAFHYPLNPKQLLHVLIPDLSLAVVSTSLLDSLDALPGVQVACGELSEGAAARRERELFQELVQLGIGELRQAQSSHGQVEQYYAQAMDFSQVEQVRREVIREILRYKRS